MAEFYTRGRYIATYHSTSQHSHLSHPSHPNRNQKSQARVAWLCGKAVGSYSLEAELRGDPLGRILGYSRAL